MASTTAGRALTEQHRRQQLAIKAATTRDALRLWGVLDPDNLDARTAAWLDSLVLLARQQASRSLTLASAYFGGLALVETGASPARLPDTPVDEAALRRSALITGPVRAKQLIARGYETATALQRAQVAAAGEVARAALQPHRLALVDTASSVAQGWSRVTSGSPCSFCAVLASRGAVYRSEGSGGFQAHGNCACTVEPVFDRSNYTPPGRAEEFAGLWNEATRGQSGQDALNAFRRAYERPALNL